ncbi:MAG: 2-oxo-4-hydroxy-4-carboxy-5-ureidoimidazoline decarboxylase [Elusimicrobia bacterium]|nr:2-oxo-4-hydroxy-4-carboxy-5-ureidoimidazoline decarboxylase [Elusimicrobiota bacterium]
MTLAELNALPDAKAREALALCCGSSRWAAAVAALRPFADRASLFSAADAAWAKATEADRLEAFSRHPRIGDSSALRAKFAATRDWSRGEQSGAAAASEETLAALEKGNADYEARFGFIFIVCASGKSADEMLALLKARLPHDRATELDAAAAEQGKITKIRLEKLLT